jgi:hypothetical protein
MGSFVDPVYGTLIGAGLGATAALAISFLNGRNTKNNDYQKWLKERRVEAYVEFLSALRAIRAHFELYYQENPEVSKVGDFPPELRDMLLVRSRAVSKVSLIGSPFVIDAAKAYAIAVADFVAARGSDPDQQELNELEIRFSDCVRKEILVRGWFDWFPRRREAPAKSIDSRE